MANKSSATHSSLQLLQKEILLLKSQLDQHSSFAINKARKRLDHSRTVRNRCYHKLREIDQQFNVCQNVNLFLDLCGGPGQFAKYVIDNNPGCKGFGTTLRNSCDYQYKHEDFKKIYGKHNSGNIFEESLRHEINMWCGGLCDLVMADGAVDVSGRENEQEQIMLPLLKREIEICLENVRPGGACVLKIFDTYQEDTVALLEYFVSHFSEHTVFKPKSSRAANSEKYLVCQRRLLPIDVVSKRLNFNSLTFARKQRKALKLLLEYLTDHRQLCNSRIRPQS